MASSIGRGPLFVESKGPLDCGGQVGMLKQSEFGRGSLLWRTGIPSAVVERTVIVTFW